MAQSIAAIALNRFGLGARPEQDVPADPKAWLIDQFGQYQPRPALFATLPDPAPLARAYTDGTLLPAMASSAPDMAPPPRPATDPAQQKQDARARLRITVRDNYRAAVNARFASAIATETPFVERLVHFWANHFALSVEKPEVSIYAAAYELEAIRPHVLGRFDEMLFAVERHPAMLVYLDQFRSVGPGSPFAVRAGARNPNRQVGLNENLAREIMELHTLGVRTGYDQSDVTEFARALTGWSIAGMGPMAARDPAGGDGFVFRAGLHEPGARRIMGRRYDQPDEQQARAILSDLARSPATARHIATKLARHFVADDPPPALVDRLAATFLDSGGDLPALYRVLIDAPQAWAQAEPKFKTPWEWAVSAFRGLGRRDLGKVDGTALFNQLGQPIWRPGSPAGYDDIAATWAAPGALMRRVELAQRFAAAAGPIDARALAPTLLPGVLTPATATALAQAESGATALALLLVSPEFQRR
jgi:uncharacterized protein (DUF1800 family)